MKFTGSVLKTKLIATGVHLAMSLVVFAYLAYQIYYHWYPEPYYTIDGGWQGMRLVAAVDLVLGPLITFLIFDLAKSRREVIFDLAVILVIQFGALAYGVMTTYSQRPVAIVLIDEFIISASEDHYSGSLESFDVLAEYSDEKPPIIFVDLPTSREGLDEANKIKLETGVLEHAQVRFYRKLPGLRAALQERQHSYQRRLDELGGRDKYESWLRENGETHDSVLIARFQGRYGNAWLVFDLDGRYRTYIP